MHARALHRHTTRHVTSCTHFDWIFELMRSLRCNYALYRDTMPLIYSALNMGAAGCSDINFSMICTGDHVLYIPDMVADV